MWFNLTDVLWYLDPYYWRRRRQRAETGQMSFIESIFSFVFGDGDPNDGFEKRRWENVCMSARLSLDELGQ